MKNSTEIISIVNQKGGTAKTTTTENLGIGLAREGKRVQRREEKALLLDDHISS